MRGDLDQPAAVEDGDTIGALGGREPVRDRDHRTPVRNGGQRALHERLGLRVEIGGGLVQHDHLRIGQGHARQADELALARREPYSPRPYVRFSPSGSAANRS